MAGEVTGTSNNVGTQTGVTTDQFAESSKETLKMQMEIAQIQQIHALQSSLTEAEVSMTKKGADTIDSGSR